MERQSSNVVRIGGLELKFLVDETNGAGELVMFEFLIPPNARVPAPHFHDAVDEAVYGLEGALTTTCDGCRHQVRAGDVVFIPRGSVHHHANLGEETARALVVLTPGGIGRRYFEEMAAAVNASAGRDAGQIEEIMRRHGLIPA